VHLGADPGVDPQINPNGNIDNFNNVNVNLHVLNDNNIIVDNIPVSHASISNKLSGISFAIQNVRSLNISTKNEITTQKIMAISNLKSDFIYLSDIRLNSSKQVSAVHDLEKQFFLNGYKFFHNSTTSLRGVGILVNKSVFSKASFKILNVERSEDGNILCMHLELNGTKFLICAVYGPNLDTEIDFYENLSNKIRNYNCPFIIGGDWNATLDISDPEHNLDILNM